MKHLILLAALVTPLSVMAETLYVDQNIGSNCSNYKPASRSCGAGTNQAFSNINAGLSALVSGDTLILRGGSYDQLNIQKSGTASQPIIIQGASDESVLVSSDNVAIKILNKAHVTIRDMKIKNVQGFGRIENSTGITFESIAFNSALAGGTTGSLKFVSSSHNRVINNTFSDGSDLLILQDDSNFNLLQGNKFALSHHSSISIRCSSQNVLRDNQFNNPDQKAMEIYDCEGVSDAPFRLDHSKRNLIEGNRFMGTRATSRNYKYNAIQHGAQQTIVRHNVFTDNLGGGVNFQYYGDESINVYGNRLYNNTFYHNRCYGIIGNSGPSQKYYDNRVVNNLLYDNSNCSGGSGQILIQDPKLVILSNNSQVNSDPGFTDAQKRDLTLTANSRQIDAGAYVAQAAFKGSGRSLVVDDASWFSDGFGISGVTGDHIRIQGRNDVATIVAINYATNTLTLSTALVWKSGDGVHLNYSGNAPDVGAFEFGLEDANDANMARLNPT
ncbi:MAG: right-handed parallel beta-helix repeat-containing protein, partial [Psychromonas sp.]